MNCFYLFAHTLKSFWTQIPELKCPKRSYSFRLYSNTMKVRSKAGCWVLTNAGRQYRCEGDTCFTSVPLQINWFRLHLTCDVYFITCSLSTSQNVRSVEAFWYFFSKTKHKSIFFGVFSIPASLLTILIMAEDTITLFFQTFSKWTREVMILPDCEDLRRLVYPQLDPWTSFLSEQMHYSSPCAFYVAAWGWALSDN